MGDKPLSEPMLTRFIDAAIYLENHVKGLPSRYHEIRFSATFQWLEIELEFMSSKHRWFINSFFTVAAPH